MHQAILLPASVVPKELVYEALVEALHRANPGRLARRLTGIWRRGEGAAWGVDGGLRLRRPAEA